MRAGNEVRVTYALVDARRREQLDGITLTAAAADPFGAQDRLVAWAIEALQLTVGGDERATLAMRGTQATEAYAYSLQGLGYLLDYQRPGAIDIAIGLFRRALDSDPQYAVAHAGMGDAYWLKYEATKDVSNIDEARAACRQALNIRPDLAAAYLCAGTIESGTGEYEKAIALFERALQIDPASDEGYRRLARAQEALGRWDEAQATYTRAVELRRHYWATHVWLANFHRSRGRLADAAREYEEAVALTPDNAPVRGILAGMYMFLGRYDDALQECQRSLDLAPSPITHNALGMTYYRMRRFDEAVTALENARALLEDYRTVGNLARALHWAGRREQARELFATAIRLGEREIEVNPRNDEVHVGLADYLARVGRGVDALAHLGRARLENPHYMFFAAMVHNQLGDTATARTWLDKAVAAGLPPAEVTAWIDIDNLRK
jgi:tetratricopeptide (TPR) repeat protein